MYEYDIKPELDRIFAKLSKKDRVLFEQVMNKIEEVINISDVEHCKNLKYGLKDLKRVHIGHFVLVFRLDKENNIIFEDFDHHNNIYK